MGSAGMSSQRPANGSAFDNGCRIARVFSFPHVHCSSSPHFSRQLPQTPCPPKQGAPPPRNHGAHPARCAGRCVTSIHSGAFELSRGRKPGLRKFHSGRRRERLEHIAADLQARGAHDAIAHIIRCGASAPTLDVTPCLSSRRVVGQRLHRSSRSRSKSRQRVRNSARSSS